MRRVNALLLLACVIVAGVPVTGASADDIYCTAQDGQSGGVRVA